MRGTRESEVTVCKKRRDERVFVDLASRLALYLPPSHISSWTRKLFTPKIRICGLFIPFVFANAIVERGSFETSVRVGNKLSIPQSSLFCVVCRLLLCRLPSAASQRARRIERRISSGGHLNGAHQAYSIVAYAAHPTPTQATLLVRQFGLGTRPQYGFVRYLAHETRVEKMVQHEKHVCLR